MKIMKFDFGKWFVKETSSITINGRSYNGKVLNVSGGDVYIDGVKQLDNSNLEHKEIKIEVNGNLESLELEIGEVKCGNVGVLKVSTGDVSCHNIEGNLDVGVGDVDTFTINGSVKVGVGDVNMLVKR
jgi:hypothetical protein